MSGSINDTLGLPKDYKLSFRDAINITERFKEASFGLDKPITKISFVYYFEKYGDFTKKNNHFNVIVNDMFQCLETTDRFELLTYFNTEN